MMPAHLQLYRVTLPSGNQAVYELEPRLALGRESVWSFGRQVAVTFDGLWYSRVGSNRYDLVKDVEQIKQYVATPEVK